MPRYGFVVLWLLCCSAQSLAAVMTDSLPDLITHVLPAGPPTAVLLAAVAPDPMLGWPSPVSDNARTFLSPEAAHLPQVPRPAGRENVVIFSDPAMHGSLVKSAEWRSLGAVQEGHTLIAPSLIFDWVDEPSSINRLLGLAWLSGCDPVELGASFNKVVYGRVLTAPQLQTLLANTHQFRP